MMKPILFPLFDNALLVESCKEQLNHYEIGKIILRQFPDEEVYVKIDSDVKDRKILLLASLDRLNNKLLPLLFLAKTARNLGAKEVGLIAPYLAYMRQDKQFHPGEGITSNYFASLLSNHFDWLMTVDPHLHRYHSLDEIYSIPTRVLHATDAIVCWIKCHINNPLIIGPDKESEQWAASIAQKTNAPFVVLEKTRKGDRSVEVSIPQIKQYENHTPILVDDIISTARTMIETVRHLKNFKVNPPICIGVHAIFAGRAYEDLLETGAEQVVTCNTVKHFSNKIDLSETIAKALKQFEYN